MSQSIHFPFGFGELYLVYRQSERAPLDWWGTDGKSAFRWGPLEMVFSSRSVLRRLERRRIGSQLRLL